MRSLNLSLPRNHRAQGLLSRSDQILGSELLPYASDVLNLKEPRMSKSDHPTSILSAYLTGIFS